MAASEADSDSDGANILLIVIISVICINLLMIYRIVVEARKKTHTSTRSKHMILLFQAVGDILVGLFPLNLRLHGMLDNSPMEKIPCWQRILAHTYLFYLMPFIHAIGIVVLVAESALFWCRQGRSPTKQSWLSLRSLMMSSFPVGLGLLLVAPLVLTGFDFEACSVESFSPSRIQSFYWVSIIVPALLAVVSACAYILSPLASVSDSWVAKSYYFSFKKGCPESGKLFTDYSLQDNDDEPLLGHGEHDGSLPTVPHRDVSSTIAWEKWNRLAAAILFCVCSMPSTTLDLMYLTSDPGSSWPDSIQVSRGIEVLYRLHVLRSLISPLLWINEYS